ncbi:MAG TPA: DUF1549 domain-containing protein [Candidatus Dormibacteraeota bacterium]|nr:DUF1549 domain-containing protein [Candidatus Dormibacteraeota bacterium]
MRLYYSKMQICFPAILFAFCLAAFSAAAAPLTPQQLAQLPAPAQHNLDFAKEIKPILEASCIKCHGRGKDKGGFRMDARDLFLKGGDSGPAIVPGKSAESLLISLVQGIDPDSVMPKKGSRLTPEQIALLRAWIDQGAQWDPAVSFARLTPPNLKPRLPDIPAGPKAANPIDRFLTPYFAAHQFTPTQPVSDRLFARRVYLDIVGLLPPPADLDKFLADKRSDKRAQLVAALLADNRNYAENWLTFWNDMLRNDYKGTGYIDGGRKQISSWLYSALLTNMPYDQFVAQLINPTPNSEGFTKGIVWRGVVNASQTPQMQAAQSISQVFMGVNLKCASCHDSFVNDLTLADAYGLAGIYADGPLEMVHCDKPTGKKADLKFFYPELGVLTPETNRPARLKQLAALLTEREDGRLTRTLVNRLWQHFLGHGLVEPVDEMEKPAWNQDLLDWLAEDFASHGYDVKFLINRVLTSQAYQLSAVNYDPTRQQDFVFRGPAVRRMSAEQFRDALTSLTGDGYASPAFELTPGESDKKKFAVAVNPKWVWNLTNAAEKAKPGHVYFRKKIALASSPDDATAVIICDNSFTLYVNGKKVGAGSDFKDPFLFDLRPFLKTGENTFAIDAVNHLRDNSLPAADKPAPPDSDNPAGLLFYARLRSTGSAHSANSDFVSDKSWLCSETPGKDWHNPNFADTDWQPATVLGDSGIVPWRISKGIITAKLASSHPGIVRAALVASDPLMTSLGRPNREQVVTVRPPEATTLQALELTNGETLADILKKGAANLASASGTPKDKLVPTLYARALGRSPTESELALARQTFGDTSQASNVEDVLWAITMLPEFQLIY